MRYRRDEHVVRVHSHIASVIHDGHMVQNPVCERIVDRRIVIVDLVYPPAQKVRASPEPDSESGVRREIPYVNDRHVIEVDLAGRSHPSGYSEVPVYIEIRSGGDPAVASVEVRGLAELSVRPANVARRPVVAVSARIGGISI